MMKRRLIFFAYVATLIGSGCRDGRDNAKDALTRSEPTPFIDGLISRQDNSADMKDATIVMCLLASLVSFALGSISTRVYVGLTSVSSAPRQLGFSEPTLKKGVMQAGGHFTINHGNENVVWTMDSTRAAPVRIGNRDNAVDLVVFRGEEMLGSVSMPPSTLPTELEFMVFHPERIYVFSGVHVSGEYWDRK